jgi:inhibitor of KinA sporulation pathway (predicted exonuclease)
MTSMVIEMVEERIQSVVEIGTKESALCTLENINRAIQELKEVRKHVRGDHKRKIDDAITVYRIIAFETMKTYAIGREEVQTLIFRKGRS